MSDSDARGRLAPVSYLPWAVPGVDPARDMQAKLNSQVVEAERARESMERLMQQSGGRSPFRDDLPRSAAGDEHGRAVVRGGLRSIDGGARRDDAASEAGGRSARAGGKSWSELVDAAAETETGAERDARIDRLVVSRLRRSSLSVAEVRDVLVEHGLDDDEVEEWIERYERLGYLDDAKLAEHLVHVQVTRRGRGSGAILSELTRRGVDAGVARAAIDALDGDAERDQAFAIAERRARQLSGLDRATAERRLSAFLQRRGYPRGLVREIVSEVLSGDRS
ncbi:RecX family transcriptional regulator [Agromyces protaetiae]|uniref:Regulatory protein RecX n=1 Tax=Agromyces protaetiae TaxID=2509455 RepID=A0A4P6FGQ3_9MICO|nr:regulatory protein RecX [Agromyces protaetiae]QAY74313.1 RecX family transcriptional regulator [Agromyces protaetiae]